MPQVGLRQNASELMSRIHLRPIRHPVEVDSRHYPAVKVSQFHLHP